MEPWEIDLRVARDESISDPSSLTPLSDLAWWWEHCMSYGYDGDYEHRIVSIQRARRRGYGSCGDAAASLLAAAARQRLRAQLCVQEPPQVRGYRHVRVFVVDLGLTLDPYAKLRPKDPVTGVDLVGAACERMLDV